MGKKRRRYRTVEVVARRCGFGVALDGECLRTPAGAELRVASRPLAEAIAAEWDAKGPEIEADRLVFTRLVNAGIDRISTARAATVAALVAYAESDLLCYRAEGPPDLAKAEEKAWRPLLDWVCERFGAELRVTTGLMPVSQPKEAVVRLVAALSAFDDMMLAAVQFATMGCGSLVLALALAEGRISAAEALDLAQADEGFQAAKWGVTEDYAARRAALGRDIASAARFMELCRA